VQFILVFVTLLIRFYSFTYFSYLLTVYVTCHVYRSGCIDVGDVICRVNGIDVTPLRHDDVMTLLEMTSRHSRRPLVLTVRRPAGPITSTQ